MDNEKDIQKDLQKLKKQVDELIIQNKILKSKLQTAIQSITSIKKDYIARDDAVKQSIPQIVQRMIRGLYK